MVALNEAVCQHHAINLLITLIPQYSPRVMNNIDTFLHFI